MEKYSIESVWRALASRPKTASGEEVDLDKTPVLLDISRPQ
jgi:hypothetical protein